MEQRSPEWFAARKGRVTGSAVGAILGLSPFMTRDDVMRRMVREWHGAESEFTGNVATEYGTFHEAGATQDYEMVHHKVDACSFFEYEDWLGASPDGAIGDGGIIEIKCPYGQRDKNPPSFKTAEEQPHYHAQMQIELFCAGRDWCDFYQWAPHGDKVETVWFDPAWIAENLPKLRAFYEEYLVERENPAEYLAPKRKGLNTIRALQLSDEYDELSEAIDNATDRKKEVLAELVALAGEKNAEIGAKKLTKVEKQGSVAYAKVVKEHCPAVDLEKYRGKPSSYWLFK